MTSKRIAAITAAGILGGAQAALAEAEVQAGKEVYETQCSPCHSNQPGVNGVGPSLAGVAGRKAGTLAGFKYTSALQGSGLTWNAQTFDQFMTDPARKVAGTAMAVMLPEAADRANLFAYLSTLKDDRASATTAAAAAALTIKGPSQDELDSAQSATEHWLYASHDYAGTRYAPLSQITPSNAASMRPVCLYRSEQSAPTQTNPIVYGGVIYLTFARTTVAIDATTCRERWTYTWQPKGHEISTTNRGVAIKDGRLVRGTADGHLIALDMGSGALLWSREIANAASSQYVSAPPLIYKDMVFIGPAGADFGPKNWIGAFRLDNGEPVWRFNLVPDPGEPGSETWPDEESMKHGGGSIWTPLSLDAKAGVLYLPVGNPAPDFFGAVRDGANLYTNSVVALDANTGKLLWYKQTVPHDEHDSDLSQVSPLFTTIVDGERRDVMSLSGKDGLLRLVDRETHKEYYRVPITTRENVDAETTVEGVHRCPGLLGGMEWNGPAYDPARKVLYVPAVDWCGVFKRTAEAPKFVKEAHHYGGSVTSDPRDKSRGWLTAFDAATGKTVWQYASPTPLVASVVATAGGVLFTGDMNNDFLVLDAANGKVVYRFNTGGSIGGGVVTYERDAKQYVATTSGSVSAFFGGAGLPAVIVFALP
jgi:alcohol dehydrogenase (cytochrome c)